MLSARLCFAIDLLIIIWMVNVSIFWIAEYSVSFDVAMYSGGDHHLYNQEWHMPHPDPNPPVAWCFRYGVILSHECTISESVGVALL